MLAQRVNGSMALGFRNLANEVSCQLLWNLTRAGNTLSEDRQYVLRVEYLGQKGADGSVRIRRKDYTSIVSAPLGATDDRWEVVELVLDRETTQANDVAFITAVNGPDTTIFIRSLVLAERAPKGEGQ